MELKFIHEVRMAKGDDNNIQRTGPNENLGALDGRI